MEQGEVLEVRLSRMMTGLLGFCGFLFLMAGLDIALFKTVFDFQIAAENKWILYLFLFFAVGCGGLIFLAQVRFFVFPPLILRVDKEGISFGTGLSYKPLLIPGKYVKSVGSSVTVNLSDKVDFIDVVSIQFENSPEIPSWEATSIGIQYFMYTLSLSWYFRDTPGQMIIDSVNRFLKAGTWKK